jgi:large subunit ribosomal protein L2
MAIRKFKPTSPSRRFYEAPDFAMITRGTPEKKLLESKKQTAGRNSQGRITSRFRGGGHKQRYRRVDFKRNKIGVPATVNAIEVGQQVLSSRHADVKPGNAMPLRHMPLGTMIHNIELKIGKGAQLVRSAGTAAQLMAKDGDYAQIRLPSGEVRLVHLNCRASVGQVSNSQHARLSLGKAGRSRWLGRRPHNRGTTMNPVDHPMGGGEGRTSGGRHPCSPWGQLAKGLKTRRNKSTNKYIVRGRKKK